MIQPAMIRLLTVSAAAAIFCAGGCASRDGAKPQPAADAQQPAPVVAEDGKAKPAPSPAPTTSAAPSNEMKGLDPTPALSRTDMGTGLVIEELKMGTGEIVWPGSRVRLNIRGWSVVTGAMYWDTETQGGPREVALATAMKGMRDGIPGMRVGGKRRISIPPDMAYGFREVKNEANEVVVPLATPIKLEIEVLEVLTKLKVEDSAPTPADHRTGSDPAPQ